MRPVPVAETTVLVGLETGVPLGRNTGVDNCIVKSSIQYLYSGGYTTSIGCLTASGMKIPDTKFTGNVIGNETMLGVRKNIRLYPSPGAVGL